MVGKFEMGDLVVTERVKQAAKDDPRFKRFIDICLGRYANCDWGTLDEEDCHQNDMYTSDNSGLILANYIQDGRVLWITTTADKRFTTLLLPGEW